MCDRNIELLQDITSCLVQMVRVCHIPYLKKGLRLTVYQLSLKPIQTREAPTTHRSRGFNTKKGSYLLSHIALQYHRRNRA